jgi:hypothetical protein
MAKLGIGYAKKSCGGKHGQKGKMRKRAGESVKDHAKPTFVTAPPAPPNMAKLGSPTGKPTAIPDVTTHR